MDQLLGLRALKDGSEAELRLVMPPEASWAGRMDAFLTHKGLPWQIHWQQAFAGGCDDLQTRFYLLVRGGEPVSNVMVCESGGIGILGHVFTLPAWRGKGAASILMKAACDDFASRDGISLYLATEYDSVPWRLYQKFGFEEFLPGVGMMRWIRRSERLQQKLRGTQMVARPLRWADWPLVQCLFLQDNGSCVRNIAFKRFGPCDMEAGYLTLRERMQADANVQAAVLVNEHGMVVGLATAMPLDAQSDYLLVDLYALDSAQEHLPALLQGLAIPDGKPLLSIVEESNHARRKALTGGGFVLAGSVPAAMNVNSKKEDLMLMIRTPLRSE